MFVCARLTSHSHGRASPLGNVCVEAPAAARTGCRQGPVPPLCRVIQGGKVGRAARTQEASGMGSGRGRGRGRSLHVRLLEVAALVVCACVRMCVCLCPRISDDWRTRRSRERGWRHTSGPGRRPPLHRRRRGRGHRARNPPGRSWDGGFTGGRGIGPCGAQMLSMLALASPA